MNKKLIKKEKENNISNKNKQPKSSTKIDIGGQAVIEGVMMRGPHYWAVAVRRPDGEIVVKDKRLKSLAVKIKIFKKPIFRGVLVLIESLIIGIKALNYSANISVGDDEKPVSALYITISFVFAALMVVGLFMAIPFYLTTFAKIFIKNNIIFTLAEGTIRIAIFIGYVYAISLMKDIRRVFQYHGAEHKVVNTFEGKEEINVENCRKYSTLHLRCGTNFVLIVLIVSIFVFAFLPTNSFLLRIGGKIILAPIIAGLAYEIIKKASKSKSKFIKNITKPGLWLQKITTRKPNDDQVKVALVAFKRVLELEKNAKKISANSG